MKQQKDFAPPQKKTTVKIKEKRLPVVLPDIILGANTQITYQINNRISRKKSPLIRNKKRRNKKKVYLFYKKLETRCVVV